MAINIDTVYQRVLAIANKEQRGYVTPQEFNLFANQAQMDIFEEYFYSLSQIEKLPGVEIEYADKSDILNEKISLFEKETDLQYMVDGNSMVPTFTVSPDVYKIGTVYHAPLGDTLITDGSFNKATGSELIQNGSFDGTTNWDVVSQITANTSGDGVLISNNNNYGNYPHLSQDLQLVPGKTYQLKYTVSDLNNGWISQSQGAGQPKVFIAAEGNTGYRPLWHTEWNPNKGLTDGTHAVNFTWDADANNGDPGTYYYAFNEGNTTARVYFELANAQTHNMSVRINNVSIKEIGTNWLFTPNGNGRWGIGVQGSNNVFTWNRISKKPGGSAHLYQAMNLIEGQAYALTFNITATNGRLVLGNHLAETTQVDQFIDGSNDNLTLWNDNIDQNGTFTKYWTQGPSNVTKLSLWGSYNFDGAINGLVLRELSGISKANQIELLQENQLKEIINSKLLKPTIKNPVYVRKHNGLMVYPKNITSGVRCNYIAKPKTVSWGYTEINGVAMYNAGSSVNFELHESEEKALVTKILGAVGVRLKDQLILQQAERTNMMDTQMKKQ